MPEQLTLEELTALLLDEHNQTYAGSIPPKALNKILYFAENELEREHVEAEVPYFWYMFGTMLATANSGVETTQTPAGARIDVDTDVSDIQAADTTIRNARSALSRSLDKYYQLDLEGITDEMYTEAPYDVQRLYRELDHQIGVATDDGQSTLFGDRNREQIRRTMFRFIKAFPTDDYPEFEDDLMIWYRLMNKQLNSDEFEPKETEYLAKVFWRLFCLELARRENNDVSEAEIKAELGIDDITEEKQAIRTDLLTQERDKARRNARQTDTALKAAEAFVVPFLDVDISV